MRISCARRAPISGAASFRGDRASNAVRINMSDEKVDFLCDDCGEAFSAFLHDMADHNAKVTACPKCGKNHEFKPPEAAKPVAGDAVHQKDKSLSHKLQVIRLTGARFGRSEMLR